MPKEKKVNKNITGIIIAYFLIYVVWGSTYFFIGMALKDIPPFLLGALRFTAAGLILLIICYLRGEKIFRKSRHTVMSDGQMLKMAEVLNLMFGGTDIRKEAD